MNGGAIIRITLIVLLLVWVVFGGGFGFLAEYASSLLPSPSD